MVLFGEIGGLWYFLMMVLTPIVTMLLGKRYHFSLFSNLYWVNDSKANSPPVNKIRPGFGQSGSTPQQISRKWTKSTKRFSMSCWQVTLENPIVRFLLCKDYFVKEKMERVLDIATDRVHHQLDVRSLIMTQNLLKTLIKLVIKPHKNRQLMRI